MPESPGEQLKRVREARAPEPAELRRRSPKPLSREVLARRTGEEGYVSVAAATIEAIEKKPNRTAGDDTLAALYRALDATPDEFPAGALAEARYLLSRWLDEREVGLDLALVRRDQVLALMERGEDADPLAPLGPLRRPRVGQQRTRDSGERRSPESGPGSR